MPESSGRTIQKEFYFPTIIYFHDVSGSKEMNVDILKHILSWRRKDRKGIVRSNVERVGTWHSKTDMHRRSEFTTLTREVLEIATGVFQDMNYDPEYEACLDNMWANISPRYGFNRHHTHPGVLWSGVYYVKAPENSGKIFFSDPRPQVQVIPAHFPENQDRGRNNWSEVYYEPIEGRMILFPAWLTHEVEPNMARGNKSESERISVSFNVFQRKRGVRSDPKAGPIVLSDITS